MRWARRTTTSLLREQWLRQLFVLSACQYLRRDACPAEYDCIQGNKPDTELIKGGSVIMSPMGEILAGPVYGKEAVLSAEIDSDEVARGKFDLDVAGHYARPDVFQLTVDTRARHAVAYDAIPSSHAPTNRPI